MKYQTKIFGDYLNASYVALHKFTSDDYQGRNDLFWQGGYYKWTPLRYQSNYDKVMLFTFSELVDNFETIMKEVGCRVWFRCYTNRYELRQPYHGTDNGWMDVNDVKQFFGSIANVKQEDLPIEYVLDVNYKSQVVETSNGYVRKRSGVTKYLSDEVIYSVEPEPIRYGYDIAVDTLPDEVRHQLPEALRNERYVHAQNEQAQYGLMLTEDAYQDDEKLRKLYPDRIVTASRPKIITISSYHKWISTAPCETLDNFLVHRNGETSNPIERIRGIVKSDVVRINVIANNQYIIKDSEGSEYDLHSYKPSHAFHALTRDEVQLWGYTEREYNNYNNSGAAQAVTLDITALTKTQIGDLVTYIRRYLIEGVIDSLEHELTPHIQYVFGIDFGEQITLTIHKGPVKKQEHTLRITHDYGRKVTRDWTKVSVHRHYDEWVRQYGPESPNVKIPDWWTGNNETGYDDQHIMLPDVGRSIVYVAYYGDSNVIKIGRAKDWLNRNNLYIKQAKPSVDVEGPMVLRYYFYAPTTGDTVVDEYLYRCLEDHLKQFFDKHELAYDISNTNHRTEYYMVDSHADVPVIIADLKGYMTSLTLKSIVDIRPKYKRKAFVDKLTVNGSKVYDSDVFDNILDALDNEPLRESVLPNYKN